MLIEKYKKQSALRTCLKDGLRALRGTHRSLIRVRRNSSRSTLGSIDMDGCLKRDEPNANRWDYIVFLDLNLKAHCIEVHPACSSNVAEISKKLRWLKDYIAKNKLGNATDYCYIWVATGGIHIPRNTPQYRSLKTMGVTLTSEYEIK